MLTARRAAANAEDDETDPLDFVLSSMAQPLDLSPLEDDDLDGRPPLARVSGRLPKSKELQGLTPRHRRTQAEMKAAREAPAAAAREDAECDVLKQCVANATPGMVHVAERTLKRWERINRGRYGK